MRKATARGRVWPQSFSTDRRYGRLSLKACALFPLMWANADDQGRLSGDPEEVKYACCPNIDHITKANIPELLEELDKNQLVKVYTTSKTMAIQILDWWDIHKPQWAWPSDYPPPDGWQDRLRYKRGAKEVVKENWFSQVSENNASGEQHTATQVSNEIASGEQASQRFLTTPKETEKEKEKEEEKEYGRGRGRVNSPETPKGSQVRKPSPSPGTQTEIYDKFVECFEKGWGLKTTGKVLAQIRDFSQDLSAAGCPISYVQEAFKEAAGANKLHLIYVRGMLLDWLGAPRAPPE